MARNGREQPRNAKTGGNLLSNAVEIRSVYMDLKVLGSRFESDNLQRRRQHDWSVRKKDQKSRHGDFSFFASREICTSNQFGSSQKDEPQWRGKSRSD
jgi:hypothetical protein